MKKTKLSFVMAALCLIFNANAQQIFQLKGRVITKNQQPLPGASIRQDKTLAFTNNDGYFEIATNKPDGTLKASYIGYKNKEIAFSKSNQGPFLMVLESDSGNLNEVQINAGYYTVKDRERTGSISSVTAETINKQPVNNLYAALIGQMPGVEITQRTGVPGGGFDIMIRGRNSLRKSVVEDGNLPFYIIDGVPFIPASFGANATNLSITRNGPNPLSTLNPNDIESVEVLKDADATAIYGSRGANGVVLITTKKGKSGLAKFDLNYSAGIGKVPQTMKLLNTPQYLEMRNEAFKNDGATPTITNAPDLLLWDQSRYTNWQQKLVGGSAQTHNVQGSFSGGSSTTQYLVSGNYYHEGTVYPGNFNYKKGSVHSSLSHSSTNRKFKADFSTTYSLERSELPFVDLMGQALTLPPNAPEVFDNLGNLNWENFSDAGNPYIFLYRKYKKASNNLIHNLIISYELIKGLKLKSNFSYNRFDSDEISLAPLSSMNPADGYTSGESNVADASSETYLIEPQVDYQASFGKLTLSVLAGATLQKNERKGTSLYATGFPSDALLENLTAAASLSAQRFTDIPYHYGAIFGRVNLNWEGKYLVNITGRRDGSSRFAPAARFANFGAIGMAWLFYKEQFLESVFPWISFGKIRGSYGITGSDQIGDFKYLDLWMNTSTLYDGKTGLIPSGLFKEDYSWEKNAKFEIAVDLGLVNDRILIAANYYRNRSSNQLIGYSLAPTTGFASVLSNFPATVQNTGVELTLNTKNIDLKKIRWTTNIHLTIPKNKLIAFPDKERTSYNNSLQIGMPLSLRYTTMGQGVDPNTGKYTFNNQQALSDYGTMRFYGGVQNTLNYNNIEISFHFQFVKQTGLNYLPIYYYAPGAMINQSAYVLSRWQNPGDETQIQRFTQNFSSEYATLTSSDQTISDAAFTRLKNVQLAYRLNNSFLNKMQLQHCKVYLQGQNLFTLTNFKGPDPENLSGPVLPALKVFTAGIQITF